MSDYESLKKQAQDGEVSVALALAKEAQRRDDHEILRQALQLHCSQAQDLSDLEQAVTELIRTGVATGAADFAFLELPTFAPQAPSGANAGLISWDEDYALGEIDGTLTLWDHGEWFQESHLAPLRAHALSAKRLSELDDRIDEVIARINALDVDVNERYTLIGHFFETTTFPTFGGQAPERQDYLILSWDRYDVLASPGWEPEESRYIWSREDYESGYE